MKTSNLNLDLKTLLPKLKSAGRLILDHAVFLSIIAVLLVYVFTVYKINQLANAEPSDAAQTAAQAKATVPHISSSSIQEIQSLEQTNVQAQPSSGQGRNNPFQE